MASPRSKSPRPVIGKNDKEESIWDKIGTLGRKKRIKEGMLLIFFPSYCSKSAFVFITKFGHNQN